MKNALPLFVLLVSAAVCSAQRESLLIGPGDQLHVVVFDTDEMDQHPRVTDAGTIPLMFVGSVQVGNMTPAAAAHAIEEVLKSQHFMLHPQVSVTVEQFALGLISIMGQVTTPGQFRITTSTPLINALSLAGGLTDLADRHITIQRHGEPGEKVTYFLSNRSNEAFDTDVLVNPGDTVLVPKAGIVYVLGDVGRPGGYPVNTDDCQISVLQALAMAGAANKTSVVSGARLIRKTDSGPREISLSLGAMQKGRKPDVLMHPDDILFVPFSWSKNIVINGSGIAASATSAIINR
jgi:polysaccharide export outer membrane protein